MHVWYTLGAKLADPLQHIPGPIRDALPDVKARDVSRLAGQMDDLITDVSIGLGIIIISWIISHYLARGVEVLLKRIAPRQGDKTWATFFSQAVRWLVMIVGMTAMLQQLGVKTASLVAMLGAASLAIGLALQGALGNVAAGVLILLLHPYRVGDLVQIGPISGTVLKLGLFTTEICSADNHKITIPNNKIFGDAILNYTAIGTRRVVIALVLAPHTDLDQALICLKQSAADHPAVLADPPCWSGVTRVTEVGYEVTLHAFVPAEAHFQTRADLYAMILHDLTAAGIELAFIPPAIATNLSGLRPAA